MPSIAFVAIPTEMSHAGSGQLEEHSDPSVSNWIVMNFTDK